MYRVGKSPIALPAGVEVTLEPQRVVVKGPLGTLEQRVNSRVRIARDDGHIVFEPVDDSTEAKQSDERVRKVDGVRRTANLIGNHRKFRARSRQVQDGGGETLAMNAKEPGRAHDEVRTA